MKISDNMFVEYDDNNINHHKNCPDYGNINGKLKWNNKTVINSASKFYLPFGLKYKLHIILRLM